MMGRSSEMVIFSLSSLVIIFAVLVGADQHGGCTESRCGHRGPAIRFPFRLKGHQSFHCGYPGFDLYCNHKNQTVLELPSSAKLLVNYINYEYQEIKVYDDDHNCLPRQLPYLNLSSSPFEFEIPYSFIDPPYSWLHPHQYQFGDGYCYDHSPRRFFGTGDFIKDYTLFNCSPVNGHVDYYIPCLSVLGYHVHAVESSQPINTGSTSLLSCTKMYDISSVPCYIFYPDVTFPLRWSSSICQGCEANGQKCRLKTINTTQPPETECFGIPKPATGPPFPSPEPSPETGSDASTTKLVVTGAIVGFFLVLTILAVIYKAHNSDKKEKENQLKIEIFLADYRAHKATRYSYADIKRITNQFKEKLGQGGYGIVFKGKLSNEILVAVKILNDSMGNGEEFINEVRTMGTIHHVNIVRLVGFCADGLKRALVYEFLSNESLEKFIFSEDDKKRSLGWERLQDIAVGIAKGIEYLHQGCNQRILHFDIKPSNVLLDHNFSPKISDFGLAKLCSKEQSAVSMTAARGTMGYIAPEVFSRNFGNVSYKSDVYSFGMLLLEMVGGRKNIDVRVENPSQVYFPEWIYNRLDQGEEPWIRIEKEGDANVAKKLTIVGLWCIQWYPVDRPSMKIVLQMLEGNGDNLTIPTNPFTSTIQTNSTTIMPRRHFSRELKVIPESEIETLM